MTFRRTIFLFFGYIFVAIIPVFSLNFHFFVVLISDSFLDSYRIHYKIGWRKSCSFNSVTWYFCRPCNTTNKMGNKSRSLMFCPIRLWEGILFIRNIQQCVGTSQIWRHIFDVKWTSNSWWSYECSVGYKSLIAGTDLKEPFFLDFRKYSRFFTTSLVEKISWKSKNSC